MKKILLLALLLPALGFSQEYPKTLSLNAEADIIGKLGITFEVPLEEAPGYKKTFFANASYATIPLDFVGIPSIDGTGYAVAAGIRTYFNKEKFSGFYAQGGLETGQLKFEEYTPYGKFDGKYSYFSFINPAVGYKFQLGKFSIDPSVGFQWNIEFKGKGDFDNRYIDNTSLKLGLRVGYSF